MSVSLGAATKLRASPHTPPRTQRAESRAVSGHRHRGAAAPARGPDRDDPTARDSGAGARARPAPRAFTLCKAVPATYFIRPL